MLVTREDGVRQAATSQGTQDELRRSVYRTIPLRTREADLIDAAAAIVSERPTVWMRTAVIAAARRVVGER